jgi:hypothetical protein
MPDTALREQHRQQQRERRAEESVRALGAIMVAIGTHYTPEQLTAAAHIYAALLVAESQS